MARLLEPGYVPEKELALLETLSVWVGLFLSNHLDAIAAGSNVVLDSSILKLLSDICDNIIRFSSVFADQDSSLFATVSALLSEKIKPVCVKQRQDLIEAPLAEATGHLEVAFSVAAKIQTCLTNVQEPNTTSLFAKLFEIEGSFSGAIANVLAATQGAGEHQVHFARRFFDCVTVAAKLIDKAKFDLKQAPFTADVVNVFMDFATAGIALVTWRKSLPAKLEEIPRIFGFDVAEKLTMLKAVMEKVDAAFTEGWTRQIDETSKAQLRRCSR